jgi:hypothetical protein
VTHIRRTGGCPPLGQHRAKIAHRRTRGASGNVTPPRADVRTTAPLITCHGTHMHALTPTAHQPPRVLVTNPHTPAVSKTTPSNRIRGGSGSPCRVVSRLSPRDTHRRPAETQTGQKLTTSGHNPLNPQRPAETQPHRRPARTRGQQKLGGQPVPGPRRTRRQNHHPTATQPTSGNHRRGGPAETHNQQNLNAQPVPGPWGSGGSPPGENSGLRGGSRRLPTTKGRLVGEEGFEPSCPCGHTDLNRARLPFRHPPVARSQVSTSSSCP